MRIDEIAHPLCGRCIELELRQIHVEQLRGTDHVRTAEGSAPAAAPAAVTKEAE